MSKTFQQHLFMTTRSASLRSDAIAWGAEDPSLIDPSRPVGYSRSWEPHCSYSYPTPLHALADGWKLLAPPTVEERRADYDGDQESNKLHVRIYSETEWWFVREVER